MIREKHSIRVLFDFDAGKFFFFRLREHSGVDLAPKPPVEIVKASRDSAWFDGKKLSLYRSGEFSSVSKEGLPVYEYETLKSVGFPDPRSIPFTGTLGPRKQPTLKEPLKPTPANVGFNVVSESRRGNLVKIVSRSLPRNLPETELLTSKNFDIRSLMLTGAELKFRDLKSQVESPFQKFSLTWSLRDGIQLPAKIVSTKLSSVSLDRGRVHGEKEIVTRIHWFTLHCSL